MLRVMAYDFIRKLKTVAVTILILTCINLLVAFKIFSPIYVSSMGSEIKGSIVSYLIILPLLFIAMNNFRKEIFENDGYLMLSIPLHPVKLFAAKFIPILFEFYTYSVLTGLFIKDVDDNVMTKDIAAALLYGITAHVGMVVTAFFALIITRIMFKKTKFSQGLSILTFLIVLIVSQFIMGFVCGLCVTYYALIKNHGASSFTSGAELLNKYSVFFAVIYNMLSVCFNTGLFIVSALLFGKKTEV